MKYCRDRFGIREAALAIAVVFMIYVTATAFLLKGKVISQAGEMGKSGKVEVILSDSPQELDAER